MFSPKNIREPYKAFQVTSPTPTIDLVSIKPVIKSLEDQTQQITQIKLSSFTYTEEALSELSETIQECQKIQSADFSNISPSPQNLETLNTTLLCLRNIYEVDLSKNNLTESSIEIFSFLFHSECLKVLRLDDNLLSFEGAMRLAEVLRNSELKLRVFSARRNCFEDQGVAELSEAFGIMGSLTEISLSENRIGKEGIRALCKGLLDSQDLRVIDLADSYLNEEAGYEPVGLLVENCVFLNKVNLNDCFLGNDGTRHVLQALLNSSQDLAELLLAYNEIDDDEVAALICEVIKTKANLLVIFK